jgi:hypothetical protein
MIAVFDAKYSYNFWRPGIAIRNADIDGHDATERDATWSPPALSRCLCPKVPKANAPHARGLQAACIDEAKASAQALSFVHITHSHSIVNPCVGHTGVARDRARSNSNEYRRRYRRPRWALVRRRDRFMGIHNRGPQPSAPSGGWQENLCPRASLELLLGIRRSPCSDGIGTLLQWAADGIGYALAPREMTVSATNRSIACICAVTVPAATHAALATTGCATIR